MADNPDPKRLRQIRRAIRKLLRLEREIFCAIRFDDLSYDEIARRIGLTTPEVERLFAAALMNLMRRLDRKPRRWWHPG